MKRWISMMMAVVLLIGSLVGCGEQEPSKERPALQTDNTDAFRLSSIEDTSDENGKRTYLVTAPYTDRYTLKADAAVAVYDGADQIANGTELSIDLTAGKDYYLEITTDGANKAFSLHAEAEQHRITLPYDVAAPVDTATLDLTGDGSDPLVPAEINYVPRKGGTYIYSNNPEQFGLQHLNQAFMRNEGLKGEVYVTFEHANYAGQKAYLGYQLKNESDHDVYITITNVGYQWTGTWFGQLAWYDFYNTSFQLPAGYYDDNGLVSKKYSSFPDYAYKEYEPRVYQPTTYRLPAGEYFWAIGGTSEDAYRNINIDNSCDQYVNPVRCANGNVKFTVTGGEVTGTMYCYTDAAEIADDPKALGYVADGYALQYSGIADHHGVIDNYVTWTFNDSTKNGPLPVTYTNYYDDHLPSKTAPYAAYNSTPHTVDKATSWMTHLNPQNNHQAVGMDLVEFLWHDENGNEVIIDNDHADGAGLPANTANWMIEYQDHFTLVNQGDTDRTVTLRLKDNGTLATLVRDSQTGKVLKARFTMGICESNAKSPTSYSFKVTVPAHGVKQITLDYLLVACSYGSVIHSANLGNAD